jgi:3-isopropylmalate/(R)-2-methylmalate dehydratase large subunit
MVAKTLYDKIWSEHVVKDNEDGQSLIYIDRQLLHEVTSPQAFEGIRLAKRNPWRISANLAVPDHNVPTTKDRYHHIADSLSRTQLECLAENCHQYQIPYIAMDDERQGIVHIIGPELGATLPGMTIVCGDSHTSTHGALGAMAMGIGTSEVEHVLATQCLWLKKMKNMAIRVTGHLGFGITAKDIILAVIGKIGTAGGSGYAIEFQGDTIENLSIESRMTLCNMAIEAGSRIGLVAVDDKTLEYVKNKPFAPKGNEWNQAATHWKTLITDTQASFDQIIHLSANTIKPQVTWGTSPEMVAPVNGRVPDPDTCSDLVKAQSIRRALQYMGLKPNQAITDIALDKIFIGSCTNSRIEDLRLAASIVKDKKVAATIKLAMVVPGSGLVKKQAEQEGLHEIFLSAGFEWREPGCSMCLGMNPDQLEAGEHCASTSNRNFEGRQGKGGRTHLVSPAMAAAAAIYGHFVDVSTQ